MSSSSSSRLAVDGGPPVRTAPLPSVNDATGRTLGADELRALERVIASGRLNSAYGTEARALEREFAARYGLAHAVTCSSGTAALHLAVAAVDPEPGDEIITTPLSDAGSVLPILLQNAVPVFADVDPLTGNLDPDAVAAAITPRTRAILVVHLFGVPAPVDRLRTLADAHGLLLVEDCAQAYLTRCSPRDRLAGTLGHVGCFSLQQSKHITAGDGGLAITADAGLARRMRLFADKGWPRDTGERTHLHLATNYRMTELAAAVARVQLGKLDRVVAARRSTAARLSAVVDRLPGLVRFPDHGASYWQYGITLDPTVAGGDNRRYAEALAAEGVPVSAGYLDRPLYRTPVLAQAHTYGRSGYPLTAPPAAVAPDYGCGTCPVAERLIDERLLVIFWNEGYTDADADDIAAALTKVHAALAGRR